MILSTVLALGSVLSYLRLRPKLLEHSLRRALFRELWSIRIYLGLMIPVVSMLYYLDSEHALKDRDGDGKMYSGGSTWGDLPFHMNIISSLVHGPNNIRRLGTWKALIFAGHPLNYYLAVDYHSALLAMGGFSLRYAIGLPDFLLHLTYCHLLFCMTMRLAQYSAQMNGSKSPNYQPQIAGFFAVLLSLFSGGLDFLTFPSDFLLQGRRLSGFLQYHSRNWVHLVNNIPKSYFNANADRGDRFWFQTLTDMLLPQRASNLVLPLMLGAFTNLWIALSTTEQNSPQRRKHFLLAGVLTALMPFCQGHSYISTAIMSATLSVFFLRPSILTDMSALLKYIKEWLYFIIPSVGLGMPQMLILSKQAAKWGLFKIRPCWDEYVNRNPWSLTNNPFVFWIWTLGIFPVLALFAVALQRKAQLRYFLAAWVIFIVGNYVQFQPSRVDNVKVIVAWHIVSSAIVGTLLEKIRSGPSYALHRRVLAITLLLLMILSGICCVMKESQLKWVLYNQHDQELARWIHGNTSPEDVFVSSDQHKHPLSNLGGRQHVMGYRGWLWSHGYDYRERESDVSQCLTAKIQPDLILQKYNASYIVVGPTERNDWKANMDYFVQNFEMVFENTNFNTGSGVPGIQHKAHRTSIGQAAGEIEDEGSTHYTLDLHKGLGWSGILHASYI
eukprot:CAMPEP_0184676414 /NCGR_PEP_ID=MMETSP0308-20130426/88339_1 /TAXON_ID=38269 /ORGANISM="Gloeochaete witrockiana, Strain SAG 46.84" /LENGTH=668 /DNA_ID=CAMNT_0027124247 /DNA_START=202 /DNA_END=2207 /DNA_ORIENTATION=-